MEIKNENNLKEIYQSLIQNKPERGKDCPGFEVMKKAFTNELEESEKFSIVDHITKCTSCLNVFNTLRIFSEEGEEIVTNMKTVPLNNEEMKSIRKLSENKILELESKPVLEEKNVLEGKMISNIWKKPLYKNFAMAAVIFLLAVGITFIVNTMGELNENTLRGQNEYKVKLISPKGKISTVPIIFKWRSAKTSLKYRIVLLDKELTETWLSDKINRTTIKLPKDILKKMKKEEIYFWKVIVFLKDNTSKESRLQEFIIRKQ